MTILVSVVMPGVCHDRFGERILGMDVDAVDACGIMLGTHHLDLRIRRIMDFWRAAIALQHGLTVVPETCAISRDLGSKSSIFGSRTSHEQR